VFRDLDAEVHRPALPLVYELNTRTPPDPTHRGAPTDSTGIGTDNDPQPNDRTSGLMTNDAPAHFGIMTPPMQVDYRDLAQVWREADTIPQIEHAYLFDHLMPIVGDPNGPAFEGWTLLSALAAQTQRLRIGLLVTSNRFRPPAMLAKIAATVDVVSSGRLDFGIGAGSRPSAPIARREYEAHGLPFHDTAHAVGALAEALTVVTRLWSAEEPFDFDGDYVHLTNAFGNPKPVQQPHPPIVIGGGATPTLRVVARHADVRNFQGGDMTDGARRSAIRNGLCTEIGRDPAGIDQALDAAFPTHRAHAVRSLPRQRRSMGNQQNHHLGDVKPAQKQRGPPPGDPRHGRGPRWVGR